MILISFIFMFVLMVMSLKILYITSYDEKTYKYAVDLQNMKVRTNTVKSPLILLERCIKSNMLGKSFRLKPPIKSIKGYNIMEDLVVLAKNNAKQRMCSSLKNVEEIRLYVNNILSEEHFVLSQNVTDSSNEK